jgi:anti-anti-sigma regulatory factor
MAIELETVSETPRERTALVRFTGILSLRDVAELKSSLKRLLKEEITNLLLDLEELKDMDEAVCEVLVSTVRKLRKANGRAIIKSCTDAFYNHLLARKWDRDFLFPSRRPDHLESLPKDLLAHLGWTRQSVDVSFA